MNDKDQIKDLFSEKLGNFEAKVNPELWANVASQVSAASGVAGTGGLSLLTKAIIGISGAAVITTGVVLYVNSGSEDSKPEKNETQVVSEVSNDSNEIENPKTDNKTIVVDNTTSDISMEPIRNIAPTTGPGDGGDTAVVHNVLSPPTQKIPEINELSLRTSTIQEMIREAGRKDITEARNNDIKEIKDSQVALEDNPVFNEETVPVRNSNSALDQLEVPNGFTPGRDGANDFYHLNNIDNIDFESFEFAIYDKFGNPVMITKDPHFNWTGYDPVKGQFIDKGQYVYVLVGVTVDNEPVKRTGTITVNYN